MRDGHAGERWAQGLQLRRGASSKTYLVSAPSRPKVAIGLSIVHSHLLVVRLRIEPGTRAQFGAEVLFPEVVLLWSTRTKTESVLLESRVLKAKAVAASCTIRESMKSNVVSVVCGSCCAKHPRKAWGHCAFSPLTTHQC